MQQYVSPSLVASTVGKTWNFFADNSSLVILILNFGIALILLFNMNVETTYIDTPTGMFQALGGAIPFNFSAFGNLNKSQVSSLRLMAFVSIGATYKGHNTLLGDTTKLDPQPSSGSCGTDRICWEMNSRRKYKFDNNTLNQ